MTTRAEDDDNDDDDADDVPTWPGYCKSRVRMHRSRAN